MAINLRLKRALDAEDPATAIAKLITSKHALWKGIIMAVRFEKNFASLPVSTCPPHRIKQYKQYIKKCELFLYPQTRAGNCLPSKMNR